MRHGRKTRSRLFNGYKRHIATMADHGLIVGALVLPANQPEHQATTALIEDVRWHAPVDELLIDRGYLPSQEVPRLRSCGVRMRCKPWRTSNRGRFTKDDFRIDLSTAEVTCPAGNVTAIASNAHQARFPASACGTCPKRELCTTSKTGRSISIHRQEALFQQLRADQKDPDDRRALRKRTAVEHGLARLGRIQGARARYRGVQKNTLDVRRNAAVVNLETVARRMAA